MLSTLTPYDWPGREYGIRAPDPGETALSWSEVHHARRDGIPPPLGRWVRTELPTGGLVWRYRKALPPAPMPWVAGPLGVAWPDGQAVPAPSARH